MNCRPRTSAAMLSSGPVWTRARSSRRPDMPIVEKGPLGPQNYIVPAQDLQRWHGPAQPLALILWISSVTCSYTWRFSPIMRATFFWACMTVVWSRSPNSRAMAGKL